MAGLLYSAARNAVEDDVIDPDRSGKPLSAEEAKQLFRLAADDVDFSTPQPCLPPGAPPLCGGPNNFTTTLPASQRFVTTDGWDQITGWGRINANTMVRLVAAGKIPPEADVVVAPLVAAPRYDRARSTWWAGSPRPAPAPTR